MKKVLISLFVLTAMVVFGATQAEAADIGVTVTITAELSVSVDKTEWAIGSISEAATPATTDTGSIGTITATNNGNATANLTITIASSTNWTADEAAAADQFAMQASINDGTLWTTINVTTSPVGYPLASGLAVDGSQGFDLKLLAPTSTTVGGTQQSITVTVAAS